jgi:protein required for attachment to host cells
MAKSVMKPRRKAQLPVAPKMERRHKRTLIVVSDGSRARFLEPSEDTRTLVSARQLDMISPTSRRHPRDIVTDRPGRGFSSARGGIRHAFEQAHDVQKLEKHKFAAALAETLDDACARRQFDRLVLVAPRRRPGRVARAAVGAGAPHDLPRGAEGPDRLDADGAQACACGGPADTRRVCSVNSGLTAGRASCRRVRAGS